MTEHALDTVLYDLSVGNVFYATGAWDAVGGSYSFYLEDVWANSDSYGKTQPPATQIPLADRDTFSPANNAYLSTLTPTFTWAAVSGSNRYYRVYISDWMARYTIYTSSPSANTWCTIPAGVLQPNRSYRWRLEVYDANNVIVASNRSVSGWNFFTTGDVQPPTDFDGDGMPDILWRKNTGSNALWYMQSNGTSIKSAGGMPSCGTSWQAGGVADFDDDGVPDILWRNPSTGSNALWYMESAGTAIKSAGGMPSCGTSWQAGGVADFDDDGTPDILWRNPSTGSNALWYMESAGTAIKSAAGMPSCGTSWEASGVADFDADGAPDILWRNPSTGSNALWYMQSNGTAIKSAGGMPSCGTSWEVGKIADFDDDGVPDILWRNPATGANALWYMQSNGTSIKSAAGMPSCGTSWEVGKIADFDADGTPDILWRNPATGSNALWYMQSNGTAIKSAAGMPSCGTSWDIGG